MCIQAIASTYTMCIQALASTYTMCIQALPSFNLLQVVGVEPCCAVTGDGLHAGVEHLHQVPLSIYTIVDHPHVFHQIKVMQAQN